TANSGVQANGVFNINGGTANINTDIVVVDQAGSTGARNSTINLAGGALNMMGHAIGNSTFGITNMNFPTGTQTARLMNLGGGGIFATNGNGSLASAGGLVMNGGGTLLIDGPSNTYTGGTTINNGRLIAIGNLPTGGVATLSGGVLGGT